MTVVLGAVAMLLLTAAVALLYAMMGELSSRVAAHDAAAEVTSLTEFSRGARVADWPPSLAEVAGQSRFVLLVLSPICSTCNRVGAELAELRPAERVGLLVSCGDQASGEDFVARLGLDTMPHLVDEGGMWTTANVGVNVSPSAVVFDGGDLTEAYTFTRTEPLLKRVLPLSKGLT